jgi:hypothetical protein
MIQGRWVTRSRSLRASLSDPRHSWDLHNPRKRSMHERSDQTLSLKEHIGRCAGL